MTKPAILIVEDEIIVAADLANKLRKLGYDIADSTDTGEEAVVLARQKRPALVLMDIRLAGAMDGIAAADLIRRECDLPVVFLTAHSDESTLKRARQVEAFGFVLKPFEERELHTTIETVLYKHAAERRLRESEANLRQLNATLEQRVIERTAQLRRLTLEMIRSEERERRRLALVLHDHLQQLLVGARLHADALRREQLGATADTTVVQIIGLLSEAIAESKSLTVQLSPPILHEAGLVQALAWLGRWMEQTHGLHITVNAENVHLQLGEHMATLLFQSVREALLNIVKHAGVTEAQVIVSQSGDRTLTIVIADNGTGFDAANLPPDSNGFGLFSISERLQLLGGSMAVASTPGHGTRLTLCAPMAAIVPVESDEASAAFGNHPAAALPPSTRLRVLVVDDHKVMREGLIIMLKQDPDIEVVGEAADGRMALERVTALHPDLVVMDLNMPEMNGIEATRAIRERFPEVLVIGLSMYEEDEGAEAMLAAGAVAYVSKSAPAAKLQELVRKVGGK